MFPAVGLCLGGLLVLVVGAELLVRGDTTLASRLGVPPIIVGPTFVAVGTSAPELAAGIDAAIQSNGGLAIGNIAGTNTVNVRLILGMSALISPLALHLRTLKLDLPAMVVAALALREMSLDGSLTKLDGELPVALGALYAVLLVRTEFAEEYGAGEDGGRTRRKTIQSVVAPTAGILGPRASSRRRASRWRAISSSSTSRSWRWSRWPAFLSSSAAARSPAARRPVRRQLYGLSRLSGGRPNLNPSKQNPAA
jgi:Ca2+/Na+ antiporter